ALGLADGARDRRPLDFDPPARHARKERDDLADDRLQGRRGRRRRLARRTLGPRKTGAGDEDDEEDGRYHEGQPLHSRHYIRASTLKNKRARGRPPGPPCCVTTRLELVPHASRSDDHVL